MGPTMNRGDLTGPGASVGTARPTGRLRRTLLLVDRSGSGLVHFFPVDQEAEKICHTEGETVVWGHTYGIRDFGVATLENKLYILGGFDTKERTCSGRILRFDPTLPANQQWEFLCPMNMARSKLAATSLDGHIYITGGVKSDGKSTGSCEMYDPEKDCWKKAGMLPSPRKDHALIAYDHSLYLSGGYQGKCGHKNIWAYEERQWREIDVDCPQELMCSRERHSMVKIDNTIFFIGGISHESARLEGEVTYKAKYEPRVDAFKPRVVAEFRENKLDLISPWTWNLFRLKTARFNMGTVAIGKKIYIIGGTNPEQGGSILDVECYDTEKNKWSPSFTLPKGNYHTVACLVLDLPTAGPPTPEDVKEVELTAPPSAVSRTSPELLQVQDKAGKWVLW